MQIPKAGCHIYPENTPFASAHWAFAYISYQSQEAQFVLPFLSLPRQQTLLGITSRNCYRACKCHKGPAKPWQVTLPQPWEQAEDLYGDGSDPKAS